MLRLALASDLPARASDKRRDPVRRGSPTPSPGHGTRPCRAALATESAHVRFFEEVPLGEEQVVDAARHWTPPRFALQHALLQRLQFHRSGRTRLFLTREYSLSLRPRLRLCLFLFQVSSATTSLPQVQRIREHLFSPLT